MIVAFSFYQMTFELRRECGTGVWGSGYGSAMGTIVVETEWGWRWYRWGG